MLSSTLPSLSTAMKIPPTSSPKPPPTVSFNQKYVCSYLTQRIPTLNGSKAFRLLVQTCSASENEIQFVNRRCAKGFHGLPGSENVVRQAGWTAEQFNRPSHNIITADTAHRKWNAQSTGSNYAISWGCEYYKASARIEHLVGRNLMLRLAWLCRASLRISQSTVSISTNVTCFCLRCANKCIIRCITIWM